VFAFKRESKKKRKREREDKRNQKRQSAKKGEKLKGERRERERECMKIAFIITQYTSTHTHPTLTPAKIKK